MFHFDWLSFDSTFLLTNWDVPSMYIILGPEGPGRLSEPGALPGCFHEEKSVIVRSALCCSPKEPTHSPMPWDTIRQFPGPCSPGLPPRPVLCPKELHVSAPTPGHAPCCIAPSCWLSPMPTSAPRPCLCSQTLCLGGWLPTAPSSHYLTGH